MDLIFNHRQSPKTANLIEAAPLVPIREAISRFWPDARPYRGWIALTLLMVALGPGIETAKIWLAQRVIDEVVVPGSLDGLPQIALVYFVLTVCGGLVFYADDLLSAWVSERFLLSLRARIFRHLHTLPLGFFERSRLGDILARLTDDIDEIETLLVTNVTDAFSYLAQIVFFIGALFFLDWRLALVALAVTPPFWLLAWLVGKRSKSAAREQRRHEGALGAVAEESLANASLVQAYNRQVAEGDRFEREAQGNFAAQLALARARAAFGPLVDLVELGGLLVIVGVGTWEAGQGRITVGGLLAFLLYLRQLYTPVRGLGKRITDAAAASASAERIIELLDQKPEVTDRPHARTLLRARGDLELCNVSYRYPTAVRNALDDVSLTVAPGEVIAVVGASGAGKSTLVSLLLRFADPSTGSVRLDGHDLRDVRLASLRDNIAVLLQETLVFDGTVRDNIAFGRPEAPDEEIVAAAKAADAHSFISALPQGYDTRVGQRGRRLSGGQRQRLAIARAMIRNAPILILDEPTTGLDAETSARVLEPLRRLMHGRTTIVISHNLLTVREASRIVVLETGRVVEQGSHDELMARGGAYARLYEAHHLASPPPAEHRSLSFAAAGAQ